MSDKIRILAIAPYEGMKSIMSKLAEEYPSIELNILVGDLKKGVEIAQSNFYENYDVVISRGGTAKLLRQSISLPVIEINTSAYDILRTLKLSNADTKKVAIAGFSSITEQSQFLKEVLPYPIDVFSINSTEEALPILKQIAALGYEAILCDMITYTTARNLGMDAFLLTSGVESIRDALHTALEYCRYYTQLRSENNFFRSLVKLRDMRTVVFNNDGKLIFSTISETDTTIIDSLHLEINNIPLNEKRNLIFRKNNLIYSVQAQRLLSAGTGYIAFYITVNKAPSNGAKSGIQYSNQREIEKEFYESIYSVTNFFAQFYNTIDQVNKDLYPVIITGEEGTGKEQIAKAIYLRSSVKDQPFIEIDCSLLNEKVWEYLTSHHNSPLCSSGSTIFIKNMNLLSEERQRQLWINIIDTDACKRNRLLISFLCNSYGITDSGSMEFINRLKLFVFTLPTLRADISRIEPIANLYLNQLNMENDKQVLGFSPDAMEELQRYHWPYNYMQFSRVMNNLFVLSQGPYIGIEEVKEVLHKEVTLTSASANGYMNMLNLSQPLNKINREVALIVLDTQNGNHTKAAKSLGISRTTLWRLINSDN